MKEPGEVFKAVLVAEIRIRARRTDLDDSEQSQQVGYL